ncbi:MAG: hypothetical protein EXX96DRAFT_545042 [Benjaminiella poitrasii]|nr:MAG: hypothetical protein EXX96DRAFT_545042 [Benjaminiella poitrasii]
MSMKRVLINLVLLDYYKIFFYWFFDVYIDGQTFLLLIISSYCLPKISTGQKNIYILFSNTKHCILAIVLFYIF